MRRRWFGSTGRRVPQIAVEGEVDLDGALVLDRLDDAAIRAAFDEGRPIVMVLLNSYGKYTRIADAKRVRTWLESRSRVAAL